MFGKGQSKHPKILFWKQVMCDNTNSKKNKTCFSTTIGTSGSFSTLLPQTCWGLGVCGVAGPLWFWPVPHGLLSRAVLTSEISKETRELPLFIKAATAEARLAAELHRLALQECDLHSHCVLGAVVLGHSLVRHLLSTQQALDAEDWTL